MISNPQIIKELKRRQGSLSQKAFASSLGITPAYLSDLYAGKRDPGPKVLKVLGLKKVKAYEIKGESR